MAIESSEGNITAFRAIVLKTEWGKFSVVGGDADSVISQYKKFLEEVVPQNKSKFLDSSHKVDQLLAGSDDYGQLWSVVKMVLLLSHRQATVERGFSVNRQVDDDNLHADTFCCRRPICDTVAYYGGVYAIDTSNKALLLSCSSAWHKYQLDLEQKKNYAMKDIVTQKRKTVDDANHWHHCWALQIFIVSHGLQMIWCQQSSFIISAVLVSTLKYIFHSKFWCSASMICLFIDTFGTWKLQF